MEQLLTLARLNHTKIDSVYLIGRLLLNQRFQRCLFATPLLLISAANLLLAASPVQDSAFLDQASLFKAGQKHWFTFFLRVGSEGTDVLPVLLNALFNGQTLPSSNRNQQESSQSEQYVPNKAQGEQQKESASKRRWFSLVTSRSPIPMDKPPAYLPPPSKEKSLYSWLTEMRHEGREVAALESPLAVLE